MSAVEAIKQQLKEQCKGKTMLRKDNSHKGLAKGEFFRIRYIIPNQ